MNIAIISLGCPKNQVDADVFCHALIKAGHQTVADPEQADIIIVNTCGFIESAKTEAIENILEACAYKQQNPELKVIVTGCLAERYRSQIEEEIPEVDAVVGCASNKAIDTIVAPHWRYRHQSAQQEMVAPTVWRGDAGGRHLLGEYRAQHSRG